MVKKHVSPLVHKPHAWLYLPAVCLCRLFTGLWYQLKITRGPAFRSGKGGLIVIGNHVSYVDPLIMAAALGMKWRANIMATNDIMTHPLARLLFRGLGVIPTTQFVKSPGATRAMIRILKEDGCVAYYPEAERSISGKAGCIDRSTAKFIKSMKKPVAFCQINGAYLNWPRWAASKLFRGKCTVFVDIILTAAEIERLSVDEIDLKIRSYFQSSDYDWQKSLLRANAYRRGQTAAGLEKILFKCAVCRSDFSIATRGNQISCSACGSSFEVAESGYFANPISLEKQIIEHPGDWYDLQKNLLKSDLQSEGVQKQYLFSGKMLSQEADLANQGAAWENETEAGFVLDRRGLTVVSKGHDDAAQTFLFKDQSGLMLDHGRYVQFTTVRRNYRCFFDNSYAPSLVRLAWEVNRADLQID